jgi:hypothetical protein
MWGMVYLILKRNFRVSMSLRIDTSSVCYLPGSAFSRLMNHWPFLAWTAALAATLASTLTAALAATSTAMMFGEAACC